MSNEFTRWEPGRNAIHRLIQFLDVMAIAFNRFRQRSFHLPSHNPPHPFPTEIWQAGVAELRDEFNAVRNAVFPSVGYIAPGYHAAHIRDEAVAEFARAGARDDATVEAVTGSAHWLGIVGTQWDVGTPRPWDYCCYPLVELGPNNKEQRFEAEHGLLLRYMPLRRALLERLMMIGQTIPTKIDCRTALGSQIWPNSGEEPIAQAELLGWVREASEYHRDHESELVKPARETKRSTERGEGRAKLIAALTKHHQYADGGCMNLEPVGNNDLAKLAAVSPSTTSKFFNDEFEGHTKYKRLCSDTGRLVAALKLLNNEFAPHHLYGAEPPEKTTRDASSDAE